MANKQKQRDEAAKSAQRDLQRMRQQSERILGPGEGPSGATDEEDFAEVWGKRIGRTLGIGFAIFLIAYLFNTYVFK